MPDQPPPVVLVAVVVELAVVGVIGNLAWL